MQPEQFNHAANQPIPPLPSIRSAVLNDLKFLAPIQRGPQFATSNSANIYKKLYVQAQVQRQTQQIDAAIQLLKMQYDSIMASIQNSCSSPAGTAMPQPKNINESPVPNQTSFAAEFELPSAESRIDEIGTSLFGEMSNSKKRGFEIVLRDTVPTPSKRLEPADQSPPAKRTRLPGI